MTALVFTNQLGLFLWEIWSWQRRKNVILLILFYIYIYIAKPFKRKTKNVQFCDYKISIKPEKSNSAILSTHWKRRVWYELCMILIQTIITSHSTLHTGKQKTWPAEAGSLAPMFEKSNTEPNPKPNLLLTLTFNFRILNTINEFPEFIASAVEHNIHIINIAIVN